MKKDVSNKNLMIKDNILFKNPDNENEKVIFNFYSWCKIIEGILVKYGNKSENEAFEILNSTNLKNTILASYHTLILTSHETEYHWAMLLLHGNSYWLNGISTNEPEDFEEWEIQYRTDHNLTQSSFIW